MPRFRSITSVTLGLLFCLLGATGCPVLPDLAVDVVISPLQLDFGRSATVLSFRVSKISTSRVMKPFTVTSTTPWLSFSPASGVSGGPNNPVTVTVTIDRAELSEGVNIGAITIASPDFTAKLVPIRAESVVTLPLAAFTADAAARVVLGDAVQFRDASKVAPGDAITGWIWEFGDGVGSRLRNPSHVYPALGSYDVKLTVITTAGNRMKLTENFVTVLSPNTLDTFVRTVDPNAAYTVESTQAVPGARVSILNLISQRWRSAEEVDKPVWRHWLTIVEPVNLTETTAILFVSGGSNISGPPSAPSVAPFAELAQSLGAVVASLTQVPSQPLRFADAATPRSEDEIIAYSFDKYLTTGDDTWPALFPMAKSAVAAMDTVQGYLTAKNEKAVVPFVRNFIVSGASKRGWTTWLAAATDPRVKGIVPMVIDVLNIDAQMDHHFRAYGAYSDAIQDYVDMRIFERLNTEEGQALLRLVDPYEYRGRLTMPKLILNSTGDEFFLPDSAQFYFRDLPGVNYLRYVPNTNHDLSGYQQILQETAPYLKAVLKGTRLPRFSWTVRNDGAIVLTVVDRPSTVKLWQATNPNARNFRLDQIGPAWTSSTLMPQPTGEYIARVANPPQGWTAYMAELTYPSGEAAPYIFTTEVRVTPEVLPY